MITIRETTAEDLRDLRRLWCDGDVMKYIELGGGPQDSDESMRAWLDRLNAEKPAADHYSVYEDGEYCGEANYEIDKDNGSATVHVGLFISARGRGIATKAIRFVIEKAFANGAERIWVVPNYRNEKAVALYERLGFVQKEMPEYVRAQGIDPAVHMYLEVSKA